MIRPGDSKFLRNVGNQIQNYILKMEAVYSSETLVTTYKTKLCHNPARQQSGIYTELFLGNSMKQSPLWEANDSTLNYSRNSPPFMEPEGLLKCSQDRHRSLYGARLFLFTPFSPISLRSILPFLYAYVFRAGSCLQALEPKFYSHFSSPPCTLHAPTISSSLIWSS
jgi:hypothetical protein